MSDEPVRGGLAPVDRVRLDALRYAVNDEAISYVAIMRTFTVGLAGLLSDQSAAEVALRLQEQGLELEVDTADARLSYLVEHGNLARSPRETEARSLKDYLTNRARYQLTQRGEIVHRQVEELLGYSESVREVSSEMLPGVLTGLRALDGYDDAALTAVDPDVLAGQIGTVFAQFERLVHSTREFYTYLTKVLSRFDLDRGEFQAFKASLLDYLQRFVDEVSRHMPQIADVLDSIAPRVPALCARANAGQRLIDLEGNVARRAAGLDPADWHGLHAWFAGEPGRDSDADGVRRLATEAMRALLVNLRRIAASSEREHSRYGDLLRLARWFDASDDDQAGAIWAAAFGLYPCRHLGFPASNDDDPVPPTASWWTSPVADVPVMLRRHGERRVAGRSGRREDFAAAKRARVAEREATEICRRSAVDELTRHAGRLGPVRLSDDARAVLLDAYASALSDSSQAHRATGRLGSLRVEVHRTDGPGTTIVSPAGTLHLVGLELHVSDDAAPLQQATG